MHSRRIFSTLFTLATIGTAAAHAQLAKTDADAQRLIQSSVVTVRGMQFPKAPTLTNAKTTASCCQPGDSRSINGVAKIDLSTPKGLAKNKYVPSAGYTEAVYSPPLSCWTISSYNRHVTDANNPYEAMDDAQPANFHYLTNQEFTSTLEEMKHYVATLNILDKYKGNLDAKLESFVKSYSSYKNEISTSHGQVRHKARVQGLGAFNGSSWYHAEINTTEICCPPEIRDQSALRQTLKSWVDDTASKLPRGPVGPYIDKNFRRPATETN
jgi:hypothetical protein